MGGITLDRFCQITKGKPISEHEGDDTDEFTGLWTNDARSQDLVGSSPAVNFSISSKGAF